MAHNLSRRSLLLQGAALPLAAGATTSAWAQVKEQNISEGAVSGVFVTPAKVPAPGIFVLHTAWGKVHPQDVAYAKALAAAGFVAFAINYSGKGKPTWAPEYLAWMAKRPEVANQPLGSVGFSMGGRCAFYFGVSPRVKAVISYYGTYDLKTTPIPAMHSDVPRASPINLVKSSTARRCCCTARRTPRYRPRWSSA